MKRFLIALATTVLGGGYAIWCLVLGLNILSAIYNSESASLVTIFFASVIVGNLLMRMRNSPPLADTQRRAIMALILITHLAIALLIPWTPEVVQLMLIAGSLTAAIRIFYVQMKKPSP